MYSLLLLLAIGKADPQQAKIQFIINAGRLNPPVSGLLMQVDSVFQLDCGRVLTLPETQLIYSSPEFRSLLNGHTSGFGEIRTTLSPVLQQFPCKDKGR